MSDAPHSGEIVEKLYEMLLTFSKEPAFLMAAETMLVVNTIKILTSAPNSRPTRKEMRDYFITRIDAHLFSDDPYINIK